VSDETALFPLDNPSNQQARTCRYPGCDRSPEPGTGPGRPPAYCDRADHNSQTAARARRDLGPTLYTTPPGLTTNPDNDYTVNEALEHAQTIHHALRTAADAAARLTEYLQAGDPAALKAQLRAVTRELVDVTTERDELRLRLEAQENDTSDQ
jgi:colicin import membrane protein